MAKDQFSRDSLLRNKSVKKMMAAKNYDPMQDLTLEDKAFAALSLVPSWTATLAYKVIFDQNGDHATDLKRLAYQKNLKTGMSLYKTLIAEMITGLKGDSTLLPKKYTSQVRKEEGVGVDAEGQEGEVVTVHHTLEDLEDMVSSDRFDKDDVRKELITMHKAALDNNEKLKILKALTDLDNMRREVSTQSEETVKYFLPLRCASCSLYNKAIEDGIVDPDS